ncbi:X-Pro dipeptidyl-peptidase C-terminal non-catalytic domain protein [Aspergillus parasiticus SU-1]|uniref:X-Pro dipeptidyl-peptidase C-terminal non-catalytic domain protein n=1 Tax=Aspergillus parasiticus (strain ATCC 56775 / NRRL 5862 / SRRC 143 / SU-1) TaxID=1403190 RepID=A0A0F0I8G7_ASPPU|nr:X-Pro dipeptidyl-peptidase C-terminal non-catalytic domain protein [Aspergillus parasiticus SU-1]
MSTGTADCFFQLIEWAAEQPWSSERLGLLGEVNGVWPQERPRAWHALSHMKECQTIITTAVGMAYGRPGRAVAHWGEDTIEGDLSENELHQQVQDQNADNAENQFLDDDYYASKVFQLEDIDVPILSVANWGGISLHLRGNVEGYTWAGSQYKFLRFIVGRHDLPFYYDEEAKVQMSFLDAFLKGNDHAGWTTGRIPRVSLCLRKGDVGFNNPAGEKTFPRRDENEWPLARTVYTRYYLTPSLGLTQKLTTFTASQLGYQAGGSDGRSSILQFNTPPCVREMEITGHPVAHLAVSVESAQSPPPSNLDLDIFVTLCHFSAVGKEVHYTGSSGESVPVTKGWLRVSLRKVNHDSPYHRDYLPRREYRSSDVLPVENGVIYECDVELWPTNVMVEAGGWLVFEVASVDTEGAGLFRHNSPVARPPSKFEGSNYIHFGEGRENYIVLPIIPGDS